MIDLSGRTFGVVLLVGSTILASPMTAQSRSAKRQTHASRASAPGSIEGDAYMTFMNGEMKQAAGQTVFLVPATDDMYASASTICVSSRRALMSFSDSLKAIQDPLQDSIHVGEKEAFAAIREGRARNLPFDLDKLFARAKELFNYRLAVEDSLRSARDDSLMALASRRSIAQAGTGMHAHFRFENVTPGKYFMIAKWRANDYWRFWWALVTVKGSEAVVRDLDNSNSGHPCT